jgi:hypothetical protein
MLSSGSRNSGLRFYIGNTFLPLAHFDSIFMCNTRRMRSVVNTVALGQFFLLVLRFSPVSIIPAVLHTYLHLNNILIRKTTSESWEPSNETMLLRLSKKIEHKMLSHFLQRVQYY